MLQADAERDVQRRAAGADPRPARSSRPSCPASPTPSRATRRRRGSRCARSADALGQAGDAAEQAYLRLRENWFERLLGPERDEQPRSYHMAYVRRLSPLEAIVHQGARDRCLPRDAEGARLRPRRRPEHQARPRRPSAEVAARLRDRVGSAEGRPPDHAGAGRAPRLPGVPARGGSRAALRGLRPDASVHVPPALARPRADGDLLVHRRGDLARAGLARPPLRPLRRGGAARTPRRRPSSRRCSSAATRRSSSSSSSSGAGSARTAARSAGYAERLTAATRRALPLRRLPLRHGRRVLLRRLPARVDPVGPAARPARRGGRRGLVAEPRRPASGCGRCSARARGPRARKSPAASASTRSTPGRCCTRWAARRSLARLRRSSRAMREQSQIDDMRAALRGDLERGRERRRPSPVVQPRDRPSPSRSRRRRGGAASEHLRVALRPEALR